MRGHEQPRLTIASPTETLLRGLLAANGRRDADARVVEGVRLLLGAEWSALFTEEGGAWVCRSASGGTGPQAGDEWETTPRNAHAAPGAAERLLGGAGAPRAALAIELKVGSGATVLALGPRAQAGDYGGRPRHLLAQVAPDLALTLRRGEELDTLRSQAFMDPLTDCYNRRGFDEHLHVELLRSQRYQRSTALMLVDLDGFKGINDSLGHQAGDHVLRRFAELLTSTFRTTDVVSRFGGDEFAVIFPETSTGEAVRLAQRLQSLLGEAFPDSMIPRHVSASFGVASYPGDAVNAETLVAATDHALYFAKTGGRDRVVAAPPRMSPEK